MDMADARQRMVEQQLAARGIADPRLLAAMAEVPRERFLDLRWRGHAYDDGPLPIAEGQTISQPYIVARMIEAAAVRPGDLVLEVGCGSGYAAAVLSRLAARVFTLDRHPALVETAAERFAELGYGNVTTLAGDGTLGLPDRAPFDAILVAAGGPDVPQALTDQLAPGGRLVIPIGNADVQQLVRVTRTPEGLMREELDPVRFVPLIGAQGWRE